MIEIAVTVEEIEIIVRTKVEEALQGLREVQAELKRTGTLDKMSAAAKAVVPNVVKAAEAMKRPAEQVQETVKKTTEQYGDLDEIIKKVEERAKKAAEQMKASVSEKPRTDTYSRKPNTATSTDSLEAYMRDEVSQEDFMKSLQNRNKGSLVQSTGQIEQMSRFSKIANQAIDALRKLGPVGQEAAKKVAAATGQATDETKKYENQVKKTTGTSKGLFSKLANHIKTLFTSTVIYSSYRKLFSFIKSGIQSSIAAPETENLFRVALGGLSDEGDEFAQKLKRNLGIDEYDTKNMLGTFQQIGTAVGVGEKTAYGMSKSMTMLANDMASLYNVDPQQAYENLQSALTGQGRAVRKYGFVITEQTAKEAAWRSGLVKNGQELTEQQKYVARGIALMEQSKSAQGDMSRTLGSVQNQLRILKQNSEVAKRSIGQAFLPIIQSALPWLNAFAVLLQRAGNALAKWSYAKFGMNYDEEIANQKKAVQGYNNISAAEDKIGESAEKAGKKAEKSLLPFDKINRMQANNNSSDSSSGSGGTGYDPGWDYEPDTGAFAGFEATADLLKEKLEKILPIAAAVGAAIAAWKIGKPIFHGLEEILGVKGLRGVSKELKVIAEMIVKKIAKSLHTTPKTLGAISLAILACVVRFTELYKQSESFKKGIEVIKKAFSTLWNFIKSGVKSTVDWIVNKLKGLYNYIVNKLKGLYNYIFPEEVRKKISSALKAIDADFGDIAFTAAGVIALFVPGGQAIAAILLGFEAVTLAIRAVGYAAEDAVQPVDIFQDGISDITKQKVEPFVQQLRTLDDAVKSLSWGNEIIMQKHVDSIAQKAKAIRETIINELDADHNEALANLSPLKENLGEGEYLKIVASTDKYYEQQKQKTEDAEAQINAIMKSAAAEKRKLTESENAKIAQLQEQMQNTGIRALSDTEAEAQAIMHRMKENSTRVSLEQASEIIKNAQKTRDKTVEAARIQMIKIKDEAAKLRDAGVITEEEYNKMLTAAEDSFDAQEEKANNTYKDIKDSVETNLGETSKYIDTETGNIKSNFTVLCEDIEKAFYGAWDSIKQWWNENVAHVFTKEFWNEKFEPIIQAAKEKLEEAKNKVSSWWDDLKKWFADSVAPKFTKKYWKDKFITILNGAKEVLADLKKSFETWTAKIKTPHMYWDEKNGYNASGAVKAVLETLHLPTVIPKLRVQWMAKGGILNRANLIGAGEAGAEAIVPLERNLGWLNKIAKQIVREMDNYASIPAVTTSRFAVPKFNLPQGPQNAASDIYHNSSRNSNDVHFRRVCFLLERILSAIKEQDFNFQIGDDEVYRSAVRGGRREALATGKPAFGL